MTEKKILSVQTYHGTSVGAGLTIIAACHPDVTKPVLTKCKNSSTLDIRHIHPTPIGHGMNSINYRERLWVTDSLDLLLRRFTGFGRSTLLSTSMAANSGCVWS